MTKIKPLFMWAGGKRKLWKYYKDIIKKEDYHTTYIELFFGGGAVFCELIDQFDKAIINDINSEIIGIYRAIQKDPHSFVDCVENMAKEYLKINGKEARKEFFYRLRKIYWKEPSSALLYFLMKLAFNGIWQTCADSNGLFGTPAGLLNHTKIEQIIDKDNVLAWNKVLQKVTILSGNYDEINVPENSLIYLDPPYRDSFTTYSTDFGDKEQIELINWAKSNKKSTVDIFESNRCVDGENFFEKLILNGEFTYIDITYTAGRRKILEDGFEAKKAKEFLVKF